MLLRLAALAVILISASAKGADAWPKRFLWTEGVEHRLVVLYRDGRAAFSSRKARPGNVDGVRASTRASWSLCSGIKPGRPLCISVQVESADGLPDESYYRWDYLLDGTNLTELKMEAGPPVVLKRICELGECVSASN
jgi:hypothetical protein